MARKRSHRPLGEQERLVLQAAIDLDGAGVFPSNRALSERTGISLDRIRAVKSHIRLKGHWRWARPRRVVAGRAIFVKPPPAFTVPTMEEWRRRAGWRVLGPGG